MTQLNSYRVWTQRESARAAELWQDHFADRYGDDEGPKGYRERVFTLIGKEMDRTMVEVRARHLRCGDTFGANQWRRSLASAHALADRDKRQLAEHLRNDTSRFFGDPAPGYSALDRKLKGLPA